MANSADPDQLASSETEEVVQVMLFPNKVM